LKIGVHIQISKGFKWTLKEAERLGCEVVQIFVKNPRSWANKIWKVEDRDGFKELSKKMEVYAHLSYLPNIAKIDLDERHLTGILKEASLCTQLGIRHLVVHCGSREDKKKGMYMVKTTIDRVLEQHSEMIVLIENSSGQGKAIGNSIEDLATIFEMVKYNDRMLLCLDTAHLFQAGYDVRSEKVWDAIFKEIEGRFGPNRIGLFHLNDSKTPLGSRIDRHWHIGLGLIGLATFRFILRDKRFAHLSGVIETPKMGKMDEENMRVIRSLFSPLVSCSSS